MLRSSLCSNSKIPIPAVDRYNGGMYRVTGFRESIARLIRENSVRILILSGLYGVLTPSERILKYEQEIGYDHWAHYGLPEALSQLAHNWRISHTFAFLNKIGAYRRIASRAVLPDAKLCCVRESTDPSKVYPALGYGIIHFVGSGFRGDSFGDIRFRHLTEELSIQIEEL
jgi:hypothetical protein